MLDNVDDLEPTFEDESVTQPSQEAQTTSESDDDYAYLDEEVNYSKLDGPGASEEAQAAEEDVIDKETREEEEEVKAPPQKPHNKRTGYYARINQMQRQRDAQQLQLLREQNAQLMQVLQKSQPTQPVSEEEQQAQQIQGWVSSIVEKQVQERLQPLIQKEQNQVVEEHRQQFDASMRRAEQRFNDFHEVVTDNPLIAHDDKLMAAAQLLPNAPEVLYHLGRVEHEDKLHRLKQLHPIKQATELVKISQEIAARTHAKKFTKAPEPITRHTAGKKQTIGGTKSVGAMTYTDYQSEVDSWGK
jgi:hypothetical protein